MSPEELQRHLLVLFRQEHAEHIGALRQILAAVEGEDRPFTRSEWEEVLRRLHTLKGAARAAGLPRLESLAHDTESWLGQFPWETDPASTIAGTLREHLNASEDLLNAAPSGSSPRDPDRDPAALSVPGETESRPEEPVSSAAVRISSSVLDDLLGHAGQLFLEGEQQKEITAALILPERQVRTLDSSGAMASLRQEIISLRRSQQQAAWRLRQLTARVRDSVREARFVAADTIAAGFGPMLRDLARETGREVDFRILGGDILADRQVLQALRDPLLHLLRNTISHGIEDVAEREAAGKPRAGQVTLRFEHEGARLRVTVDDDGRGMDRDRIARVAVERGLLGAAEAEQVEIDRLIFESGFSTTERADRISGRGMGLPVVAQTVASLQGEVAVAHKLEPGARIVISTPLSLSLHRLLLVRVGARRFGFPVQAVEGLHRIGAHDVETAEGAPYVRLDGGAPVRLAFLAALLGLSEIPAVETHNIAVLRQGSRRLALAVDGFLSDITTVVREPGPYLPGLRLTGGSFLLRGGGIGLALNVTELFQRAWSAPLPAQLLSSARREPRKILVVDDSITTRTLERSILESRGYRVRVAVDGAEAFALLREGVDRDEPIADLVIADVEMPHMNGFELLEALKRSERLSLLPFILVTSRDSEEDRERGVSLGADAYIVKRQFDQRHLLETIEQLLY